MAQFATSLVDSTTNAVDISISCSDGVITINDNSNYDDVAPEGGHARSFFTDYKKITVTLPDSTTYVFSTLVDGDALIDPPSVGVGADVTSYTRDGDGVYMVKLVAVPTWDVGETYQLDDDYVYYGGLFYKALTMGSGSQPDTNPTDWEEVTEASIGGKYSTTEGFYPMCDLNDCLASFTHSALCLYDMCPNDDLRREERIAVRLIIRKYAIMDAMSNRDYVKAANIYNEVTSLCNC